MSRGFVVSWVGASSWGLAVVSLALIHPSGPLAAATKAERASSAEQLVSEALNREIYGRAAEREKLLDQATQQVPDYAPAMWHRGFVRYQNKWVKADDVPQLQGREQRIELYEKTRDKYPTTVEGQFALAQWCAKRGLADQARAHVTAVLTIEPDHAEARALLGFRQVDGEWLSAAEIETQAAQASAEKAALAAWRPKLEKLLHGLKRDGQIHRDTAAARLRDIRDVSAIPALEGLLAGESELAAGLVVEALAGMPENAASLALARLAVDSPWKQVRDAAAKELTSRPQDSYVPTLLASLSGPIITSKALVSAPGGRLMYRHTFAREGQETRDVLVLDTSYNRVALPDGNGNETLSRAATGAQTTAVSREMSVVQRNEQQRQLNLRICAALSIATGQNLPTRPDAWWTWWNQYNEVFVADAKQTRTQHQTQQVAVVDQSAALALAASGQGISGAQSMPMDCLAAGTQVWTAAGTRDIEKIRVGDLVLSQNPETGELTYKPVLRTTIRPKSKLVKISAGGETIQTSGGHLFWVSGEGWVKSRNVQPGVQLHAASGTAYVSAVDSGSEQVTYNLIVADFNTYFVGKSRLLSHDNTVRQATDAVVPGLVER